MIQALRVIACLLLIAGCSKGGGDVLQIDKPDVKGSITAPGARIKALGLSNNEGKFEAATVDYKADAIQVAPTKRTFEEVKKEIESQTDRYVVESSDANSILYQDKGIMGDKTGFGFTVIVVKDDKSYALEGEGENPLKPIPTKARAEELLNVAKTFQPK